MATKRDKPGQPTKYTPEVGKKICDLISTHPHGLPTLVKMFDLPDRTCIYNWLNNHREFFDSYMRAKEQQAHLLADEVLEIAKNVPTYEDKDGHNRIDNGMLGRSKLEMDALRWSASVLAPKFYRESKNNENSNTEVHADVMKRKHELDEKNKKEY
jgi:terminase small subunit-like protein